MLKKLNEKWEMWSNEGIKFPFAHDSNDRRPSATLLFYYMLSFMTIVSLIFLHFVDSIAIATFVTMCAWLLSYIMYRIRKVDKVKFDVDDKSIEIN